MSTPVNVAVVYYSSTGTITTIARAAAQDAKRAGAQVRLRRAAELAPQSATGSNLCRDVPVPGRRTEDHRVRPHHVVRRDLRDGGGSPRCWRPTPGGLWQSGQSADKVYSGFTASSTAHGGQESTLLALYNTIHHFGGILVAPGHTARRSSSTATRTAPRTCPGRATSPSAR
ncbi:NAD(P)H dehydrogenase [Streptomyces sp. ISL-111]|nr:NAD(P)H dehydrogenase [Streptomyces sp. ISL-111]